MTHKLRTRERLDRYALRKSIVEPVNGQIKEIGGFRRFGLRGYEKVRREWALVCTGHNLKKLIGAMQARLCLRIIGSDILRQTPTSALPCNGWLSSRTGSQSACILSDARHIARQRCDLCTLPHCRSEAAPGLPACPFGRELPIRYSAVGTTGGSSRHRSLCRRPPPQAAFEGVRSAGGPELHSSHR